MDIFAHGLWGVAAARLLNQKRENQKNAKPLRLGWVAFWNVAPDLFSFGIFFLARFLEKGIQFLNFVDDTGPNPNLLPGYIFTLYNWTHSLVIFGAVFLIVWLIRKKPMLEMLGWGLHILIDIPTHTSSFFPTPFLFPISNFRISLISWGNPTFFLWNYVAIAVSYISLAIAKKRRD